MRASRYSYPFDSGYLKSVQIEKGYSIRAPIYGHDIEVAVVVDIFNELILWIILRWKSESFPELTAVRLQQQ